MIERLPSLQALLARPWFAPAVVALVAWTAIVTHVDPGGSYPQSGEGPGLTIDETFNVQQGVLLVEQARAFGVALVFPENIRPLFHPKTGQYLADHPPLGRLWLGLHHHVAWWWHPPTSPDGPFVSACARTGSATAFALTILLLGSGTTIWYGRWPGLFAAVVYALIPRVYGHAHLASLETFLNLTYSAAVLAVAMYWNRTATPSWKTAVWTGALFGLVLLSKMQAVFIPIPLGVWALARWRHRALMPLAIWGLVGLSIFVVGWPTMWFEPWETIPKYFRGASDRAALSVWYFGQQYTDRTAPRSYAAMFFLATVPLVVPALAMLAVASWRGRQQRTSSVDVEAATATPREALLFLEAIFPLVMFSMPGVPVYDAERLWLPAVPLWTALAAAGFQRLTHLARWTMHTSTEASASTPTEKQRERRTPGGIAGLVSLSTIVVCASFQLVALRNIAPCFLSHYTIAAAGLPGVRRDGWELNYWGDAVSRSLLLEIVDKVPAHASIAVAPVMHQFQVAELLVQSPILRAHHLKLVPYDGPSTPATYLLTFARLADLPPELRSRLTAGPHMAVMQRHGVVLAALDPFHEP